MKVMAVGSVPIPKPSTSCVGCEHFERYDHSYHTCRHSGDMLMTLMDNSSLCPLYKKFDPINWAVTAIDWVRDRTPGWRWTMMGEKRMPTHWGWYYFDRVGLFLRNVLVSLGWWLES